VVNCIIHVNYLTARTRSRVASDPAAYAKLHAWRTAPLPPHMLEQVRGRGSRVKGERGEGEERQETGDGRQKRSGEEGRRQRAEDRGKRGEERGERGEGGKVEGRGFGL